MPTEKIPFGPVFRNSEDIANTQNSWFLMNGYFDHLGGVKKFPGLNIASEEIFYSYTQVPCSVVGVNWWNQNGTALIITDEIGEHGGTGRVYSITKSVGRILVDYAGSLHGGTFVSNRAIFATDGTYTFVATGGKINYIDSSVTPAGAIGDVNAPAASTHIAWLDGYLLSNNTGTNKFYWSDVNNSLTWSALSFASAAGDPDYITALHVKNRQIYLFGTTSIEIWENDGVNPFSRIPGGFIQTGLSAPYSVVLDESSFYFLDDKRKFVKLTGGTIERLSTPYDRDIQNLATIGDCLGDKIEMDGHVFLLFQFPGVGKSYLYDRTLNTWQELGKYFNDQAVWGRWRGNCYAYCQTWGLHLIGDSRESRIFKLDPEEYNNWFEEIRFQFVTGNVDHGTSKLKRCDRVRFKLKRGKTSAPGEVPAQLLVRYRDDGKNDWSQEHVLSLGAQGQQECVVTMQRLGCYYTRQWEFTCTEDIDVAIIEAEEDFTVLR